jgi:hypothetical protein
MHIQSSSAALMSETSSNNFWHTSHTDNQIRLLQPRLFSCNDGLAAAWNALVPPLLHPCSTLAQSCLLLSFLSLELIVTMWFIHVDEEADTDAGEGCFQSCTPGFR